MSAQDVELYRQSVAALNRGDIDWIAQQLDPEFEFVTAGVVPDTDAVYTGAEGLRKFWSQFGSEGAWETLEITVAEATELDDGRVLGLLEFHGVGRGSGADVHMPYGHLLTMRDGKALRLEGFASWDEARRAAGLD